MTTQHFSHAESAHPTAPQVPSAAPKLHVQRSLSREAITIHFSPLGKEEEGEEEEEEELYASNVSAARRDSNVVTALEAREEMPEEGLLDSAAGGAAVPASSASLPSLPDHRSTTTHAPSLSLFPNEKKLADSSTFSPTKSVSLPSIDKPSLGMTKSHSSDVEPRNAASSAVPLLVRHRHLMKTLVKSLSSDTSQESSSSTSRISDSRLNLQLFKQFTQSRMPTAAASSAADSKTAPSSPLTSPESRNFFKVSEVEACIEDTKRRLSEAIYEPLQMLSKIMDEKNIVGSVASYRAKPFSVSASELSNMASLGHLESNNNSYCIKEEEEGGDCESDSPNWAPCQAESPCTSSADTKSPKKPVASSMSLDKCSMSALAKLEDEDFCILHNEDFDSCTDIGGDHGDRTDYACGSTKVAASEGTEPCSEDELEIGEPAPTVPFYTLLIITALVYGYFVLPLPTYIGGMLLGVGLGFFIAIAVVWLAGPKPSGHGFKHFGHFRNTAEFTIEEPAIFKGWMNEIMTYDPETYHATLTHSIYVRLEGSILRLSKPNRNVTRRATHNEAKPEVTYISQKIYDLTDSKVYLMPENLARKRVWNKKYPICIELGKQDDFMSKVEGELSDVGKELSTSTTVQGEKGAGSGATQGRRRTSSSSRCLTLHLFGRTGREKEEWFRRILLASKGKGQMKSTSKNALSSLRPSSSQNSLDEALAKSKDSLAASSGSIKTKSLLDYGAYMATLMPTQASPDTAFPALQTPQSSPEATKKLPPSPPARPPDEEQPVAWLNAAVGRVLWDFLGEPHWAKMVSKKIQMKLSKIRLPYFMNELTLTELDMGMATPRILGASQPSIDHQGLWFDLDISYSGSFLMTLETKMNLIRLGKEEEAPRFESGKDGYRPRSYCLADSDEESSSAGSSDEEDPSELTPDSTVDGFVGGHKPSKIMKFVDKITKSKYFQKATETEFIKKKMEEVSNTPLLLTVEVQELQGTLAVNIPPPPTDRIWYGFRTPPHVELKARPKLGEREVTFAHVTDWIEKKLYQEFQKIFVMPNMDDLWLTIMHSAMDPRTSGGPLVPPATNPLPSQQAMGATKQQ